MCSRPGFRMAASGQPPPMESSAGHPGCPKRMVFGPCGGVRDDGACEVAAHRCVFLDQPLVEWPGPAAGGPPRPVPDGRPTVLADLSVTPYDPASVRRIVGILAPSADGL